MQPDNASPPDVLAASRAELVESHVIHEFDSSRVVANLKGSYGQIMARVYRSMLPLIKGTRIVDCGAGFGQFSRIAIDAGLTVKSIDIDDASLSIARHVMGVPVEKESAYAIGLPDGSCDTVVCCNSIQHLDIAHLVTEARRLGATRVIIYNSNIENPYLIRYREKTGHEESNDRTADEIAEEFKALGFSQTLRRYENVLALALSGGFQRAPVPILGKAPGLIYTIDKAVSIMLRAIGLDRRLAFRFVIVLDRQ